MKRHKFTIAGITLMALLIAVPAFAGQQMGDQQMSQVSGTVIKEKQVDIKGKDQKNQIVLLQTARGERVIADLGDAENVGDINIQSGKQLEIQGKMVRVSNQPVLLASKITAGGKSLEARQAKSAEQRQTDMAGLKEQKQVSGKIIGEKNVNVRGQDMQYKVVLLEVPEGDQVVADLGPADQLNMDLKKGEQVDITGNIAKIGNQYVLLASSVSAQGKQSQIKRGGQQQ